MADKIQLAAANKLLKTLEEPESQSLFILIAESSDQMLPTILSRTQLVKIPPLSEAMIRQQLVEREGVTEQEAADLAAVSDGSYVRALNLLHDSAEMHHLLTNYNIIMKSIAAYLQNPKDLARINYLQVQDVLAELAQAGREMQKRFLNYTLRMFRNSLLLNTGNNSLVRATSVEWKVLDEFRMLFTLKDSSQLLQECSDALYHLERNANVNILFTDFYFKLLKAFSQR
jgi:DNA polymerase-3 subunit delta'